MEYTDEKSRARMVLTDKPTVRQLLQYKSHLAGAQGQEHFERLWLAAQCLIERWDCEILKLNSDLGSITDPAAADVITWAGVTAFQHYRSLSDLPKNS